ncbi:MAG: HAMP domain-containing protein [Alphaproteobacteria bacterium]|nr:HAMP domain-containing protein [Alphaproteobacteria bacterium]
MAQFRSPSWNRLPFVVRLMVTATIALLVAGAAMLFFSARQDAEDARSDLAGQLQAERETLPAAVAEVVVIGDFSTLQQILDRYVGRQSMASIRFQDASGVTLESVDAPITPVAPAWFASWMDLADVSGTAAVVVGGHLYGEVALTLTAQGAVNRVWRRLLNHLAILALAIGIDFLGIWLVLRQGLAPLSRLQDGARALAEGDMAKRIAPEGSPEMRRLITAFNDMAEATQRSQDRLVRARDDAEIASKAKSKFLSSMSHELRTPLNSILGFAQVLDFDRRQPLNADQKVSVDHIMRAGQQLLELIEQVLDLARIESGRMTISIEDVVVDSAARECIQLTQPHADDQDITVLNEIDPRMAVRADWKCLRQVLLNLVSNGIKYNRKGGRLTLRSSPSGPGWGRISVIDTGEGIPEDLRDGLFEPFNRLGKEGSDVMGTGIGLTVSRELTEAMGGRIGYASAVGEGSTFWIELPLA